MKLEKLFRDETVVVDPSLYPGIGQRLLDVDDLEDLMGSKGSVRLRKFVKKWQPLLPTVLYQVGEQEDLRMARDMRRIIQALIELMHSNFGRLTRGRLEALGIRFGPGAPQWTYAIARIAFESHVLAEYIEGIYTRRGGDLLQLPGSEVPDDPSRGNGVNSPSSIAVSTSVRFGEVEAGELHEDRGMFLAAPDMSDDSDAWEDSYRTLDIRITFPEAYEMDSAKVIWKILEDIFNALLLGVGVGYGSGGAFPLVPDVFTGLVFLLAAVLDESSTGFCKACGDPMLAPRKGGVQKAFCSEPCRQRFLKAKRFWELVQIDGLSHEVAARAVRIDPKRAKEVVEKNRKELDEHVERLRAEREAEAGSDEGPNGH